jgi:hypothetical protein
MHSRCNKQHEMSMHMMLCSSFSASNTKGVTLLMHKVKMISSIDWIDYGGFNHLYPFVISKFSEKEVKFLFLFSFMLSGIGVWSFRRHSSGKQ